MIIVIYVIGCNVIASFYISNRGPSCKTAGAVPHLATRCRQWTAKQLKGAVSHLMRQKKDFSWMHSVGDDSGERRGGRSELNTRRTRLIASKWAC